MLARNRGSGFASKRASLLTLVKWLSIQRGNKKKCQPQKKSTFPAMHVHRSQRLWLLNETQCGAQEAPLQLTICMNPVCCTLMAMLPPLLCPGASPSREAFWATQGCSPSVLTPFLPYCLYDSTVIVSLVTVSKYPNKGNLEEKGSLWLTTLGFSPSWQRGQGGRNLIGSHITSAIHSREG